MLERLWSMEVAVDGVQLPVAPRAEPIHVKRPAIIMVVSLDAVVAAAKKAIMLANHFPIAKGICHSVACLVFFWVRAAALPLFFRPFFWA